MNGESDIRVHQPPCALPSHQFASRPSSTALFHSAPPLFWDHRNALTAVPCHRPLGGAVAPPTRAGGARKAEAQPPNRAWRGVRRRLPSGLFLVLFLLLPCCSASRPVPSSAPTPTPPPALPCLPPSASGVPWLSDLPGRSGATGGGPAGRRTGWGLVALSFQPIQASDLPGP